MFEKNYQKAQAQQPQELTSPLAPEDRLKIGNSSLEWGPLQAYQGISIKLRKEIQKANVRNDSETVKFLSEGLARIQSRQKQIQMIKVFLKLNPERPILLSSVYSRDGKPDPIVAFVYRYKNRLPKVSHKLLEQAA